MTLGAALADDYDLQFATSGQQGLTLAAGSPPDLILLDIMMPEMDGYEVCRRLKADPSLQNIPVIFVTALAEMDAESAGLELGAADYLTKPINVGIARQRIRKAQAKGLDFEMQQPASLPQTMTGDAQRLQQVLEELLGNAVKFTEQGKVTFAVAPGTDQIEFAVTDSGVGMTTEQLEAGFKPFQQADGSTTRRFGGLGLGLALTEHLVKLMGGEIAVTSKMGEGTTFRVRLPL